MPRCQRCQSNRILEVNGKTSDCCYMNFNGQDHDGYVVDGLNIDDGSDYLTFSLCLECGQIQGKWPVADPDFEEEDY